MAKRRWIPAFAGMTVGCAGMTGCEVALLNVMSGSLKRIDLKRQTYFGCSGNGLQ